jgi:hypothetical protein
MAKQIRPPKVPAARVILDDEQTDDKVIKSSIKFKKGNKNKPVLIITVGLGGFGWFE